MESFRSWEEFAMDASIYESMRRFNRNAPLIDNITKIFSQLCLTFQYVYNFGCGLHMFINPMVPETDILFPENGENGLYKRIHYGTDPDKYQRLLTITRRHNWLHQLEDTPVIIPLSISSLSELSDLFNIPALKTPSKPGFLIPFDMGNLNLGFFILWGEGKSIPKKVFFDPIKAPNQIAALYHYYCDFLNKEYQLLSEFKEGDLLICRKTYLPSFNASRWARAAILFADIHNFTPFTELLRNIKTGPDQNGTSLQKILNIYFEVMARIIQEGQGRIDRFFGAGIMAVFGEYESDPLKVTKSAVCVAERMVNEFRDIKETLFKEGFGEEYKYEFNESVDLFLGIGIDYGTVLMDYLGDERHKEYTVAGDHVNFARLLGYEACRNDPIRNKQRPDILISRTVYQCIKPALRIDNLIKVEIQTQDHSYPYTVYTIPAGCLDE